jgi:hypothetical protein
VNSFQLTTVWVLGAAAVAGCAWVLVWAATYQAGQSAAERSSAFPYRINSPFVEVRVADGSSLSDLRRLFESIRDDPGLPSRALLLFDSSARKEKLAEADVRARLDVFLNILRAKIAPAYAVVVSSAISTAAETAQREAEAAGVRVGLFEDFDRARRWLSKYATAPGHS